MGNENTRRTSLLSRVSTGIFGFLIALIVKNLEGIRVIRLTENRGIDRDSFIIFAIPVITFSIFYLLYWYFTWVANKREEYANKNIGFYLIIGLIDCAIATLPYWGYAIGFWLCADIFNSLP